MKTYTRILNTLFYSLIVWMIIPSCFCQNNCAEILYNRNGTQIVFNKVEGVLHKEFVEGTPISTKNEVLNELSGIDSYTMFPDSSYRFIVAQQSSDSFKAKTTQDSTDLTSAPYFNMPVRSLYTGMDDSGLPRWLNIPAQFVLRDSATRLFTFNGVFFSQQQVYKNQ